MSRIRADKFVNNAANGAPQLTYGAEVVAGVGLTGAGGINITGIATAASFSSATGSFTGDVDIADKIVHTGDTDTAIRFPAADTFTVETGGSEAIRVDSSQRLLVGSTSARANFFNGSTDPHIQLEGVDTPASTVASIRCSDNAGSPRFLMGKSRGGSVGSNTIVQDNDDLGEISFQGSDGTQFVQAADIRVEVDGTPGADDMPGRIVFGTTADGAASPTERLRITSTGEVQIANGNLKFSTAGTGIDFSANANAAGMTSEVLDDYEEGTFTPALKFGDASVSMAGSYTGKYTKIGRMVYYLISIILTNKGSSTGSNTTVEGMPFASDGNYASTVAFIYSANSLSGPILPRVRSSGTVLDIFQTGASGYATVSDTAFNNTSQLQIVGTYFT